VANGWDDDDILAALRHALSSRRAVPEQFVAAGKSAFTWRNIDAELAQLTYDSSRGADLAGRTRAEPASIRALSFTSAHLSIEVEVTEDALLGQVIPAQAATLEVQTGTGTPTPVSSDEIGCFSIQPPPRGTFRLRCRTASGIDVLTGWITLLPGALGPDG
jgi:hypothetical protein